MTEPGVALSHDLIEGYVGEKVDAQLDHFIEQRHEKRVKAEGERRQEAAWKESERRAEAKRRAQNKADWLTFHLESAARWRALAEAQARHHEEQANRYVS